MINILQNLRNGGVQFYIPSDLHTVDAGMLAPTVNTDTVNEFGNYIWFQGNFDNKYIADLPFDRRCFQPSDRYIARFKRVITPAPHFKSHTTLGENNYLDELTMVFQEGSSAMLTELRSASWTRVRPATTSSNNTRSWRRTSINNANHVSPLRTDASPNYFIIDPALTDNFYFANYVPSYQYSISCFTNQDNKPKVGVVTIHFGACTSTTAPNIVAPGMSVVWFKPFTPVSGKPFRVVADIGMVNGVVLLTGVSNP